MSILQRILARRSSELRITFKIILFIGLLFILYLFGNYFYVRSASFSQVKSFLNKNATRIIEDLKYENGQWDTSIYLADTEIKTDDPVYIFTLEGFLIDRINQINGFLGTSDFEYALSFKQPQTVTSPINELWRIYSKPIEREGKIEGAILVGFFEPKLVAVEDRDKDLIEAAEKIDSEIEFKNEKPDVRKLETKEVSFEVSFEVVDKFNKALKSEGGLPAYIDRSFVQNTLKTPERNVKDEETGEPFLVLTKPILDSIGSQIGVVAVGRSLKPLNDVLRNQLIFSLVSAGLVLFSILLFSVYLFGRELPLILRQRLAELREPKPMFFETISFNATESFIQLDGERLPVPADSYQHDVCKAIFSSPKKKWEAGDLLEKMGYEFGEGNRRKAYDAAMAINKRVREKIGVDLILYRSKVYQINSEVASKIS